MRKPSAVSRQLSSVSPGLCPGASRTRGFTLIELVVVIGIIVVLAAITVALSRTLFTKSEVRKTESTLTILDSAVNEWQANSQRQVSYGKADEPFAGSVYEINEAAFLACDEAEQNRLIRPLLAIIGRNSAAITILSKMDAKFLKADDPASPDALGPRFVIDAWDTPVRVVFPGRSWDANFDSSDPRDEDGTIITESELRYGSCVMKRIAFISAGPDGKFGDLSGNCAGATAAQAEDNVYSYSLDRS